MRPRSQGSLEVLPKNIRSEANTLAYYDMATIIVVKSFLVYAQLLNL
jgi:hypothetical protein